MKLSKEPTYTILPAAWSKNIRILLESNKKIKYDVCGEADIPEGVPDRCIFKGREVIHPIVCIKSNLIPEELTKAVEDRVLEAIIED